MTLETLLDLIDGIYAAGLEPVAWSGVLTRLADELGAREAALGILGKRAAPWIIAPRTNPEFALSYQQHYHLLNLFWRQIARQPVGAVSTDAMLLERAHLHSSEFFNDWSAPQGYRTVMGTTLVQSDFGRIELQIPSSREFEADQQQIVTRLVPHLTRSLQVMQMLSAAQEQRMGLFDAFHALDRGVVLLDYQVRIVDANASAERYLAASDGLVGGNNTIAASLPGEQRRLQAMLGSCTRSALTSGGTMRVTRHAGAPLVLTISPFPAASPLSLLPGGGIMVIIADPEARNPLHASRLQERYGLTAAELALALEIAKGDGRRAAAERRGVSVATARSQLSSIFDKTGVRRQAELVRLLRD